jgi:hypothetical protein
MRKLMPVLMLLVSLFACKDSIQNSDKQKDMTRGSSPPNSMTATDQQNYGAATQAGDGNAPQDPSHTQNLTNPSPSTPTPQARPSNEKTQPNQGNPKE